MPAAADTSPERIKMMMRVRTTGTPVASGRTYFLAYPKRNAVLPALGVFRQWLLDGVATGGECG